MAQELDPLSLIAKRKAEMEASRVKEKVERERLDAIAAERAKEEEELAIAERVIARLAQTNKPPALPPLPYGPAPTPAATTSIPQQPGQRAKIPAQGGAPRPEGIPTVPQMVTILLEEAERRGLRGLRSTEIMAGINDRWWPGVAVNLIMPTVYRCISAENWFEKEGKLIVRLRGGQPPNRHAGQLKLNG